MLAATYESAGDSGVLEVRELQTPDPGPGEVRVRIAVSGVNPTDWKLRRRSAPTNGMPAVPNQDGAGTIDAVGPGVDKTRLGERVWLLLAAHNNRWGTAAEYCVVPAERAIPLPDSASFELGASLGVPALTAWHCLCIVGQPAGLTVLAAGGAGAVGRATIELARHLDAETVIATVSGPEKAAIAEAAGADLAVNYRDSDASEQIIDAAPTGVDRFVEVALDQNLALDMRVAAPHAVITSYAADPDSVAEVPVRDLMAANIALRFMLLYTITPAELRRAIDGVSAALKVGALSTPPLHRYSLAQVAEAHDAVERGAVGKVLIEVDHEFDGNPVPTGRIA